MTERKDIGKSPFIEETEDDIETTMPQLTKMTKTAWAVFEIQCINPRATQVEIATAVKVTRPYVSRIVNSAVYKTELRAMRKSMLEARLDTLGAEGLNRMIRIVQDNESSDSDAISATRLGLDAMGYTGRASGGAGPQVVVNNNAPELGVTSEMVEEAVKRRQAKLFNNGGQEITDVEEQE